MYKCLFFAPIFFVLAVAGCSKTEPTDGSAAAASPVQALTQASVVRLDEAGIVATVGSSVVREYAIDDGRGLHFRSEGQPDFKLEFRTGRVNVAWMQFKDDPSKHGAENAQNAEWAEKVLRYALGADASAKAIDSVNAKQSATFDHLGHKVSVMPSGMLNLVTIR